MHTIPYHIAIHPTLLVVVTRLLPLLGNLTCPVCRFYSCLRRRELCSCLFLLSSVYLGSLYHTTVQSIEIRRSVYPITASLPFSSSRGYANMSVTRSIILLSLVTRGMSPLSFPQHSAPGHGAAYMELTHTVIAQSQSPSEGTFSIQTDPATPTSSALPSSSPSPSSSTGDQISAGLFPERCVNTCTPLADTFLVSSFPH